MILILSSRYVTTADQCLSLIRPTTSHRGSPAGVASVLRRESGSQMCQAGSTVTLAAQIWPGPVKVMPNST